MKSISLIMTKIIIKRNATPFRKVTKHLKTQGYSLYAPYQEDGVKWLISRENNKPKSKELFDCQVCMMPTSVSNRAKISCCKGEFCLDCLNIWSQEHDGCPQCRQPMNIETDHKIYGGILCDEMGLGKTLQMISMIYANPMKYTLIVLPSSLIDQWMREFRKFAPQINLIVYYGSSRPSAEFILDNPGSVVLTSYGMVKTDPKREVPFTSISWDRLILDECHQIRNPKSKIFKSVIRLKATNKWGITGTPLQNYKSDLTTLMKFLGVEGQRFSDEMLQRYVRLFILRRTKKMVEEFNEKLKLPDLEIETFDLEFQSKEERNFYNKIRGETSEALKNYKFDPVHAFEMVLRMKQVSILPQLVIDGYSKKWKRTFEPWKHTNTKLDFIVDHLDKNREHNTIVFCQFHGEMKYLKSRLCEKEMTVKTIDGSVSGDHRDTIVKNSRKNGLDVLIVQINAGGTGLNLQHFNRVYFTSPSWNPALKNQAIARAHRIGQTKNVKVFMPLIKDTIDQHISKIQQAKEIMFSQLVDIV